jgi:hypothetical protein
MAKVEEVDLDKRATMRYSAQGWEATRVFMVTELDGDGHSRMAQALALPDIPVYFSLHPSGNLCWSLYYDATALEATKAEVTIGYGVPEAWQMPPSDSSPPHIQVGTSLVQARAWKDVNGDQLITSHRPIIHNEPGAEIIQAAPVDIMIPMSVARFWRREPQHPAAKSGAHVGHMNQVAFGGDAAKWWLCTLIDGQTQDGAQSWWVQYEFQRNVETWDAVVVWVDPDTNRILTNPVPGESLREYVVYKSSDFNALSLGF